MNIPTILKSKPISVLLADNKTALPILHETIPVFLHIQDSDWSEQVCLDILPTGSSEFSIILGLPWLLQYNPSIDWTSGLISFSVSKTLDPVTPVPALVSSNPVPALVSSTPVPAHVPSSLVLALDLAPCSSVLDLALTSCPDLAPSSSVLDLDSSPSALDLDLAHASSSCVIDSNASVPATSLDSSPALNIPPCSVCDIEPSKPSSCTIFSSGPDSDAVVKKVLWSVPLGNCPVVPSEHHTGAAKLLTPLTLPSDLPAHEKQRFTDGEEDSVLHRIPVEYQSFTDVFSKVQSEILPMERPYDCEINLKNEDLVPPFRPLYNLSGPELQALKEYIDDMLQKGFIRLSKSPAGAPIFFVKKKDGCLRPCVDYRELNDITIKNRYPLPLISELLDRLGNAKIFTKIDLRGAYNLVRMKPGHEWKTAFRSRFGHYEYLVMPFGLTNAPAIFQSMMNDIFASELDIFVIIYLDDILIFSEDSNSHIGHVKTVLERLREFHLYAKLEKCEFHKSSIEFLGYIVSATGLAMAPDKIQCILDWKAPSTITGIQSFLGFCNFYRKFIQNYSALAKPLTDLTKKSTSFQWTPAANTAFLALKEAITQAPLLRHADPTLPFTLETDASDFAIGAVLSQPESSQSNSPIHPVAFFSRKLLDAECNYTIHDKELLAIVDSMKFWRHYLAGSYNISVYSDHKNLTFFRTRRVLKQRHARWAELLSEFDFKLCYNSGQLNTVADALSRRQDLSPKGGDGSIRSTKIETTLLPDTVWNMAITTAKAPYQVEVTDDSEKLEILQSRHDSPAAGHPGQEKTYDLVTRNFWWPGIREYIKNYVRSCEVCQRSKASRHKPYGLLEPLPIPDTPWSSIGMDFIVKLPVSHGFDSILVFVCRRTKQAHFVPCNEAIDAVGTANLFLNNIFKLHGLPASIVSDRGPQFKSLFWKAVTSVLGIKLKLSSAYHPQTDGQTERTNQTLEQYLRCFINYQQDNWVDLLPLAEFSYNNASSSSSNISPFFANYGYHPRADFLGITKPTSNLPSAISHIDKIQEASQFLTMTLQQAQENSKKFADNYRMDHNFTVGEQVWLLRKNLKTKRPSDKLDHIKLGPFKILEAINPVAFRLDLPESMNIHPVFHVSMLEKFHPNDIPQRIAPPPLPVEIDGITEYEVEDILDSKFFGKTLKYLVKWKGYPDHDNSWEPESSLEHCPEILSDFKSKYPNKLKKKPKKRR
jgi:hypothetical protein